MSGGEMALIWRPRRVCSAAWKNLVEEREIPQFTADHSAVSETETKKDWTTSTDSGTLSARRNREGEKVFESRGPYLLQTDEEDTRRQGVGQRQQRHHMGQVTWAPLVGRVDPRPQTLIDGSANSTLAIAQTLGAERMLEVTNTRTITCGGWTPFVTIGRGIARPLSEVKTESRLVGNYRCRSHWCRRSTKPPTARIRYEPQPAPASRGSSSNARIPTHRRTY